MLDDRTDLDTRRVDNPNYPPAATNDDASFAVPALIIAAILIIGGYFVVTYNSDNVRTASTNAPATQSAPAPTSPAAPANPAPKQ